MFNRDTSSIIVGFLSTLDLYSTIKVDRLWHKVSQNQLELRYKLNPILPILHNKQIQELFITHLRNVYYKYMELHDYSFENLINYINRTSEHKHDITYDLSPYTKQDIDLIYDYLLKNIKIDDNSPHILEKYVNPYCKTSLFEKAFHTLILLPDKSIRIKKAPDTKTYQITIIFILILMPTNYKSLYFFTSI